MQPLWQEFIGRDHELRQLLAFWHEARAGAGPRVAILLADKGFGKTRLLHELYRRLAEESPKEQTYWPATLCADPTQIGLNPSFPEDWTPKSEIPWLWWGLRWADPQTYNRAQSEGFAAMEAERFLHRHILPMLERRTRGGALVDAGKAIADLALNFIPFGNIPSTGKASAELFSAARRFLRPIPNARTPQATDRALKSDGARKALDCLTAFLAATGEIETTYNGHGAPVIQAVFNSRGTAILSLSPKDKFLHEWDPKSESTKPKHPETPSETLQFASLGYAYVFTAPDRAVRIVQMSDRQLLFTLRGHRDTIQSLAIHPSTGAIATGAANGEICLWNLACGTWSQRFMAVP